MTDSLFRPTFEANDTNGKSVPGASAFQLEETASSFEPPGPIIPTRTVPSDAGDLDALDSIHLIDIPDANGSTHDHILISPGVVIPESVPADIDADRAPTSDPMPVVEASTDNTDNTADTLNGAVVSEPTPPAPAKPTVAEYSAPVPQPASPVVETPSQPVPPVQPAPQPAPPVVETPSQPVPPVQPVQPPQAVTEYTAAPTEDPPVVSYTAAIPPQPQAPPAAPPQPQAPPAADYTPPQPQPQAPQAPAPAMTPVPLQPQSAAPALAQQNRVEYLPMPSAADMVNAPVLVIEHRHIEPTTISQGPPPAPSWSLGQLLSVLGVMAVLAVLGSAIGWVYGGRAEPVYAARSEFIYFLDDAVPDGFLREDRRILTQLVTLESETVLQPIAADFDTTVSDLRDSINVEVVDLSEVIRLDVEDTDQERALAINNAILSSYTKEAESTFSRVNSSGLQLTRDDLLAKLQIADEQSRSIQIAEAEDVELRVIEESLSRELEIATQRFQNLRSIDDGLLVESTTVDDTASLTSQISAANDTIRRLEGELVSVRSEREQLAGVIRSTPDEFAYQADSARQQDAALSVREESIQTSISTAAERVRRLEALRAESFINNEVQPNAAPVSERLASTEATMADLESQLLNVRTKRTQVAQRAAALPSVSREVDRLEAELRTVEGRIADLERTAQAPSPIEVLTKPLILDEPVGNPRIQMAALGFIASVPIAVLAAAVVRSRQRRRRF